MTPQPIPGNPISATCAEIAGLAAFPENWLRAGFPHRLFWPLDKLFALDRDSPLATAKRAILLLGAPPLVIVGVCCFEGTLRLDHDGIGIFQHPGFLAFFLVHILLVILLPYSLRKFRAAVRHMPHSVDCEEAQKHHLTPEITHTLASLLTPRSWTRTKLVALAIGIASVAYNIANTLTAENVYGHDVWDSSSHWGGYIAAKLYLAFTWGMVVPIAVHALSVFCYIIARFYGRLSRQGPNGMLAVQPLSADRSGGFKPITTAVLAATVNAAPLGLFTVALAYAHGVTVPLIIGTTGWIMLVSILFFGPLYSIHGGMCRRRDQYLQEIENRYSTLYGNLRKELAQTQTTRADNLTALLEESERLSKAFQRLEQTSVWPFDYRRLVRFFTVIVFQLLLTLLGLIMNRS